MNQSEQNIHGCVRESSSTAVNQEIDQTILQHISRYVKLSAESIIQRLKELIKSRILKITLEVNASSLALTGLLLGTYVNKKWYILPGVVPSFLLQHGPQGWCTPLPLFCALGVRTRHEIYKERYTSKVLRGDFDQPFIDMESTEILDTFRD